ncbi:MAG: M23 family metallopeptidase, partial [Candidatus Hydrogenedentes bacterium]|nr:M23 family metallopeptidase [Candidatus Hydrogenedentota bacterium]
MKKWTVMLIPHDRGGSRTLNLSAYQIWVVVMVVVGLSFTTSFFFKRHQCYVRQVKHLEQVRRDMETRYAQQVTPTSQPAMTAQERLELEQRLRSEYDATLSHITVQLSELRDMENQARGLTGLAPRRAAKGLSMAPLGTGKGGGSSSLDAVAYEHEDAKIVSPSVIYGLSQPSADLIIQEIDLRTASLQELVRDLRAKQQEVSRLPSIWPTLAGNREISSPFGFRKDPYTLHISRHDGADITAPYGSPIISTAAGVVVYSAFDPGGLGNLIKVSHGNGIETWYGHLEARLVNVGDRVDRKTVIGKLGTTGRSTGPHVHYEVHV